MPCGRHRHSIDKRLKTEEKAITKDYDNSSLIPDADFERRADYDQQEEELIYAQVQDSDPEDTKIETTPRPTTGPRLSFSVAGSAAHVPGKEPPHATTSKPAHAPVKSAAPKVAGEDYRRAYVEKQRAKTDKSLSKDIKNTDMYKK